MLSPTIPTQGVAATLGRGNTRQSAVRRPVSATSRGNIGAYPVYVGYLRCSTGEQADSGAGLAAQRAAISAEADRRGWTVRWIEDAGYSGKDLNRPGLAEALNLLVAGEASGLVVAKLDRVSRSVQDFAALMETARRHGWSLVALDLGVDTTTPAGELVANVMAAVAQWERRVIGGRTAEALAARKAQGVRLGRPVATPADVRDRIAELAASGASHAAIARILNAENVPTATGARWFRSSVRKVLLSVALDTETASA